MGTKFDRTLDRDVTRSPKERKEPINQVVINIGTEMIQGTCLTVAKNSEIINIC